MEYFTILVEKKEKITRVTFNRPEKMNALNEQMAEELVSCLEDLDKDAEARVVIFTGAGKAFLAGADLRERFLPKIELRKKGLLKDPTFEFAERGALALSRLRKVTIAAVNGAASGLGSTLALACDIRLASTAARFTFPFLRLGILPEFGATYYLPRLVGMGKACELIFTGDTIDAQEAKEIGLVNKIFPEEKLMEEVFALARKIAKMPPLALSISKRALYQGLRAPDLASQLQYETLALVHLFGTADHEEGVRAFLEKREPFFQGK
ncbi:MAG: enoyl-CoA hydratase/isomerase family protein [Thermodesulfobacteriota bacterium]